MKLVLLIIVTLYSQSLFACRCVESTDEEEYKASENVLIVRVTSTKFVKSTNGREFDSVMAYFDVIKTYKGNAKILKFIKAEKTTCELSLISGEYYLVYSRGGKYETLNKCTKSRWVDIHSDKIKLDEEFKKYK